ncbi:MAG: TatD family hydrolase [Limisphaerales bacterium]
MSGHAESAIPRDASFSARQVALRATLGALRDPQEQLAWIVDRSRARPSLPAEQRNEARLVPGCAARLWLVSDNRDGRCHFACDSDSAILKAAAGLLCELYDGLPPAEVLDGEPTFLAETRWMGQLTENRRRTVHRVREAIRAEAARFVSGPVPAEVGFFDAHNHLHDERFSGRQDELIAECRQVGIVRMVVNGSSESDWDAVAALALRHPGFVIPAFGVHPWYVHERTPAWKDRLNRLLDEVPGAVVGEIGLDRWILDCPPAARATVSPELASLRAASLSEQMDVFGVQLQIAAERNLPASIHCLQAWGALADRLRSGPRPACGFLLHSYGGPAEMVDPLAAMGAYFGFPGYFLHARKGRHRETFRTIPDDRLLVETDAPDQRLPSEEELVEVLGTTDGMPGAWELESRGADTGVRPPNHPANLGRVYHGLAKVRGLPLQPLAASVGANFRRLFSQSPVAGGASSVSLPSSAA